MGLSSEVKQIQGRAPLRIFLVSNNDLCTISPDLCGIGISAGVSPELGKLMMSNDVTLEEQRWIMCISLVGRLK